MTKPTTISILETELKLWLKHIQDGLEPDVKYSKEYIQMLEEAYEKRGEVLNYLNERIRFLTFF